MSQFVGHGEYVCHTVIPVQKNKGIETEDIRAEAAGALAFIFCEIYPALSVSAVYHFHVILAKDGKAFADVFVGLFDGDSGIVLRIHSDLKISKSHLIQAMLFLKELGEAAHMRSQTLCDHVYLTIVHLPRHLLLEKQAVEDVVELAQLSHDLFLAYQGVIGCCRGVFVFLQSVIEVAESCPSHLCVFFILVIILKERVAHGIFLAACGKGLEVDVRQLQGIVNGIGHLKGSA